LNLNKKKKSGRFGKIQKCWYQNRDENCFTCIAYSQIKPHQPGLKYSRIFKANHFLN